MEGSKEVVLLVKPTLDGEVFIQKRGGKEVMMPLKTQELEPLPPFLGESHTNAMGFFHELLLDLKKTQKDRLVPMTRGELFSMGFDKKLYKDLLKAGLLQEKLVNFVRQKDKTPTGARATVFYTAQGRAFVRKFIDSNYCPSGDSK